MPRQNKNYILKIIEIKVTNIRIYSFTCYSYKLVIVYFHVHTMINLLLRSKWMLMVVNRWNTWRISCQGCVKGIYYHVYHFRYACLNESCQLVSLVDILDVTKIHIHTLRFIERYTSLLCLGRGMNEKTW